MIDTVKGFYSDKRYEWGYMVQNSDVTHQEWIYDTLHCNTLERMREVAKKEYEKIRKIQTIVLQNEYSKCRGS